VVGTHCSDRTVEEKVVTEMGYRWENNRVVATTAISKSCVLNVPYVGIIRLVGTACVHTIRQPSRCHRFTNFSSWESGFLIIWALEQERYCCHSISVYDHVTKKHQMG